MGKTQPPLGTIDQAFEGLRRGEAAGARPARKSGTQATVWIARGPDRHTRPRLTKLLAIDDERMIRSCLGRVLPRHGFEVECVETGAEAQDRVAGNVVEVVLLDRFLAGEDGLDVCEGLRRRGYVGLIVMMTGDSTLETHVRALAMGADDFISKPFEVELLVAQIRAGLRRKSNHFVVAFGSLTIDVATRIAYLQGNRLSLTDLELDMLCYLAVRAGETVTWESLVEDVWGQKHMADLGTVRVRVAGLREKLGEERERVETVRGVGLRFKAG